jgi:hypothetical protein
MRLITYYTLTGGFLGIIVGLVVAFLAMWLVGILLWMFVLGDNPSPEQQRFNFLTWLVPLILFIVITVTGAAIGRHYGKVKELKTAIPMAAETQKNTAAKPPLIFIITGILAGLAVVYTLVATEIPQSILKTGRFKSDPGNYIQSVASVEVKKDLAHNKFIAKVFFTDGKADRMEIKLMISDLGGQQEIYTLQENIRKNERVRATEISIPYDELAKAYLDKVLKNTAENISVKEDLRLYVSCHFFYPKLEDYGDKYTTFPIDITFTNGQYTLR